MTREILYKLRHSFLRP